MNSSRKGKMAPGALLNKNAAATTSTPIHHINNPNRRTAPVSMRSHAASVSSIFPNAKGNHKSLASTVSIFTGRLRKTRTTLTSAANKQKEDVYSIYSGYHFSVLSLSEGDCVEAAVEMLVATYCMYKTQAKKNAAFRGMVRDFVVRVQQAYFGTNFHNFSHAVDVAQMMFTLITKYFSNRMSSPLQPFFLIVICICHDISHPGASAAFLQKHGFLSSEFTSLERFHVKQTMKLLNEDPLFSDSRFFTSQQFSELTELADYVIDATDMKQDKDIQSRADSTSRQQMLPKEHLAILMKVSDLANVVRNFEDAETWSAHLNVEMMGEAELSTLAGTNAEVIQVAGLESMTEVQKIQEGAKKMEEVQAHIRNFNMDELQEKLPKATMWFINNIVKSISDVFKHISEDAAKEHADRLRANLTRWHELNNMMSQGSQQLSI